MRWQLQWLKPLLPGFSAHWKPCLCEAVRAALE